MPNHCYICGSTIDSAKRVLRRKVRTGEYLRRNYATGRPISAKISAGYRVVCLRCAKRIDFEEGKKDRLMWLEFGAAVVFLAAMWIASLFQ